MPHADEQPDCPSCGAGAVPIVYGLPGREAQERARRGEIVLGGCYLTDGAPCWACPHCGWRWGRFRWQSSSEQESMRVLEDAIRKVRERGTGAA